MSMISFCTVLTAEEYSSLQQEASVVYGVCIKFVWRVIRLEIDNYRKHSNAKTMLEQLDDLSECSIAMNNINNNNGM
jgi:uncharacterized membrane protein YagU involved in acid resistance